MQFNSTMVMKRSGESMFIIRYLGQGVMEGSAVAERLLNCEGEWTIFLCHLLHLRMAVHGSGAKPMCLHLVGRWREIARLVGNFHLAIGIFYSFCSSKQITHRAFSRSVSLEFMNLLMMW